MHGLGAGPQALIDRLHHHHGVIHDHAKRDHDAEQDRIVQGHAAGVQQQEGPGQRERDADAGQDGDARAEEGPGDQQHQREADQGILLHQGQRPAGADGLVVHQRQPRAGCGAELVSGLDVIRYGVHQFQRVGAGLLGDGEQRGGLAVKAHDLGRFFRSP